MNYLHRISLSKTLPCLAEPGKIIAIGVPDRSLEDVLPYLATLPGVIAYNPGTRSLTFRRPRGFMTLFPNKVNITQIKDAEEGLALFEALVAAINSTWEHRAELVAVEKARQRPQWLDIWAQLPQTNCSQCGESTCMAFSAALLQGKREITECIPLASDPAFNERRETLEAMVN
jgi:ArsR family metal-binding transcriptional regulator